MAGLLDQYSYANNLQALKMVVWMAECFGNRVQNVIRKYSIERHWRSLNEETGGMNDVLYKLYSITGDQKHLTLAHLFDKPCFLGSLALKMFWKSHSLYMIQTSLNNAVVSPEELDGLMFSRSYFKMHSGIKDELDKGLFEGSKVAGNAGGGGTTKHRRAGLLHGVCARLFQRGEEDEMGMFAYGFKSGNNGRNVSSTC